MSSATCFIPSSFTLFPRPTPLRLRSTAFNPYSHSHSLINRTCPVRHANLHYRTPPKCSSTSTSSPTPTPSSSPSSLFKSILSTSCSLSIFLSLQRLVSIQLSNLSLSFPPSLAAMLVIFSLISLLRFLNLSPPVEKTTALFFTPGVTFLTRWLAVFFVPNLVMLPLAPRLPSTDLPKILIILIVGFAFTLLSSAAVCSSLRYTMRKLSGKPATEVPISNLTSSPPSNPLIATIAIVMCIALALCTAAASVSGIPSTVYALTATLLTFTIGQRFSKPLKTIFHPLITCTGLTIGLMALLGLTTGVGFQTALATYYIRGAAPWAGGGNILAFLLGPAVITFAFTMDKQRRLALARITEVVGTSIYATLSSLFGTALAARALRCSSATRLLVIPRTITAPLAVAIAEMLGANVGLAASVVALTGLLGANVAAGILTMLGVKDPVVRGLSVGASAHGLGTAAMSDEGGAFPFAALAMTLVGVFSTLLVAWAPFRTVLIRIAVGSVFGAKTAR